MTPQRLPGFKYLAWLRSDVLKVGVLTGVYLCVVMVAAVLAANRVPFLDPVAEIRNWVARVAFGLVMLIPIVVYRRSAVWLFFSAILGWTMLCLAYWAMGFPFENLHTRLRPPLNLFMIGAVVYGVVAVMLWVGTLIAGALKLPVASRRRRP
jgi:hypothetical protein